MDNQQTTTFDRQGYIVIEKNDGNAENIYLIAKNEWFTKMPVSSTYADYGQQIDAASAGDYLELLSETAVNFANGEAEEDQDNGYKIGDIISAYDNRATYDFLVDNTNIKHGEDIEITRSECLAYTYWNGHNWATISIEHDDYEPSHKRLDEEKEIEILKEYFEFNDYDNAGPGCLVAKGKEYIFTQSAWQGSWEIARVEYNTEKEEA